MLCSKMKLSAAGVYLHQVTHPNSGDAVTSRALTLQSSEADIPESVLRQHAPDSAAQDFTTTPFGKHLIHRHALQATGSRRVRVVLLLESLLSRSLEIMTSHDDHIVSTVC